MIAIGLDIGALNVKLAVCRSEGDSVVGETCSFPFEAPELLQVTLEQALADYPDARVVAAETVSFSRTMHRRYVDGVAWTLDLLTRLFGTERVRLVTRNGELAHVSAARADPWLIACRNWAATAMLAAQYAGLRDGLLVDCGTSSLDVVPVQGGRPLALDGADDRVWTRLATGELTLTGVLATSVQSITPTLVCGGRTFTTRSASGCMTGHLRVVAGAARVSEVVPGASDAMFSQSNSRRMVAELVGADETLLDDAQLRELAQAGLDAQRRYVAQRIRLVSETLGRRLDQPVRQLVCCGLGARSLIAPAMQAFDGEIIFLDRALADAAGLQVALATNCESALGAALLGLNAWSPTAMPDDARDGTSDAY